MPIVKVHLFKFAVNDSLTRTEKEDIAGKKLIKKKGTYFGSRRIQDVKSDTEKTKAEQRNKQKDKKLFVLLLTSEYFIRFSPYRSFI